MSVWKVPNVLSNDVCMLRSPGCYVHIEGGSADTEHPVSYYRSQPISLKAHVECTDIPLYHTVTWYAVSAVSKEMDQVILSSSTMFCIIPSRQLAYGLYNITVVIVSKLV